MAHTTSGIEHLIQNWSGLGVVVRHDAESGAWIFICLHDPTLGPCSGGTRMKVYPSLESALQDGMNLAEGMTQKWAAIDMPYGGGKAVIALAGPLEGERRVALLHRYGELIERLGGIFQTGEDLGTSPRDLATVAERTRFVHGFDAEGVKQDPSPYTARGVFAGIRGCLGHVFGDPSPADRSVLVQGVGNVGRHLARELAEAGARLLVADIDGERAAALAAEVGGDTVLPDEVTSTACDVYAPCAVGGTVDGASVPGLACRIVAGSANNQLGEPADAERLRKRGITYAPDFIINAGGAKAFALMRRDQASSDELFRAVEGIEDTVLAVLSEAAEAGESSLAAAERRVGRALAAAREAAG